MMRRFTRWLRATLIMLLAGRQPMYINIVFPSWHNSTGLMVRENGPAFFLMCDFTEEPPAAGEFADCV